MRDQLNNIASYQYDTAGRLDGLTGPHGDVITDYQYDSEGRLARETKGNGTYSTYAYGPCGTLTQRRKLRATEQYSRDLTTSTMPQGTSAR